MKMKDGDELLLPWSRTAEQQESSVGLAQIRHGRTDKYAEDQLGPGLNDERGGSRLEQRIRNLKTLDALEAEVGQTPVLPTHISIYAPRKAHHLPRTANSTHSKLTRAHPHARLPPLTSNQENAKKAPHNMVGTCLKAIVMGIVGCIGSILVNFYACVFRIDQGLFHKEEYRELLTFLRIVGLEQIHMVTAFGRADKDGGGTGANQMAEKTVGWLT